MVRRAGSSANSPPNTSQSSSGALPGARTPGRNGPASRSPVCATPSPTGHGPCTGEIAIFASTATTDSLLHNESKTSSPRSTETPPASSGDNPKRPPSGPGQAQKAITRWGHLPPSQWSQFGLTLPVRRIVGICRIRMIGFFCGSRWRTRAGRRMTRRGGCGTRWRTGLETGARIPAPAARTGTPPTRGPSSRPKRK